jgi:GTP-binding protein
MFRAAIVGRPNVGKSTLFNRLVGARRSIVGDEPGITRDRIHGVVSWEGNIVELVDTGGMVPGSREIIPSKILEQVEAAIAESDLLLWLVDARAGMTALDEEILARLRKSARPVWVVANKVDTTAQEVDAAAFYGLGFERVFPVSAEHSRGIGDLLDALGAAAAGRGEAAPVEAREISVAVVGRPNVGKSSIVNRLLGSERAIVCAEPGTTRDAVDMVVERDGVRYRIIDTAGIRRKGKTEERTEKISVVVARKNLEAASVALLLIDAEEGVTKLDAAIGGYAHEAGCSVILVLNKWDRVEKTTHTIEEHAESVYRRMKYLSFAPIITVSALTGQRVDKLFGMIRLADDGRRVRVATGVLNNMFVPDIAEELAARAPARRLDIRYVTQARVDPPVFVVFTSGSERLHFSTERFVVNRLREKFGFYAAPIRIEQRTRKPKKRAFSRT